MNQMHSSQSQAGPWKQMAHQMGGTEVDLMKELFAKTLARSRELQRDGDMHSPATMRSTDLHQAPGVTGAGRGCAVEDGHSPRDCAQRGASTTTQEPGIWGGQYLNPLSSHPPFSCQDLPITAPTSSQRSRASGDAVHTGSHDSTQSRAEKGREGIQGLARRLTITLSPQRKRQIRLSSMLMAQLDCQKKLPMAENMGEDQIS